MKIRFQQIKERPINYVNVILNVEEGCKPEEGEYGLIITNFLGYLDITCNNGNDDLTLIKEAITNEINDYPKNGELHIVLKESGEWEDVFWNKYYIVERVCKIEH